MLDDYESFQKGPLAKKLYKLSMYCLANELFSGVGVTMTKFHYSKLAQEALKKEYFMGPSFLHCLLDTTLFICEQGLQCIKTGSIGPLIHGEKSYQKWFDDCMELKVKAKCLTNPEPHGFTKFEFLKDLSTVIEQGDAISKFASQIGANEKKLVRSLLCEMKMMQADSVTKGAAQKTRKAPFAVLVYAGSSVGKSTFTDILFTYHGKIAKLPQGSEYRYAVNFADEFQSGFTTSQWCWLIDDIAFQHPNSAQGVDASLMNVIQANNNAAFVTNQADLPDKGRIPMWCEQVIGTTNVKHLNAIHYFTNPLAVQRRFPFVVELAPKPEFAKDECMLDGQKVSMVGENEYPDWWVITVWRVIPKVGCTADKQLADHELALKTDNIGEFLMWYHKTWTAYDAQQKKVLEGNSKFDHITLCDCHHLPLKHCPEVSEMTLQALQVCEHNLPEGPELREFKMPSVEESMRALGLSDPTEPLSVSSALFEEPQVVIRNGRAYPVSPPYTPRVTPESEQFTQDEMAEAGMSLFENEQALDRAWELGFGSYFCAFVLQFGTYCFLEFTVFRTGVRWMHSFPVFRRLLWKFLWSGTSDSRVLMYVFGFMGDHVQRKIGRVPLLVTLASVLTTGLATYKLASWIFGSKPKAQSIPATFRGTKPTASEEKGENVWFKDQFRLTDFDVPQASRSLVGSVDKLGAIVERNVIRAVCHLGGGQVQEQMLLCLGGQIYVANNHGIPTMDVVRMDLIQSPVESGITSNISAIVTQSQILRYPSQDLCFMELKNLPPKAKITKFIPNKRVDGRFKGLIISRNGDGQIEKRGVLNMFLDTMFVNDLLISMSLWNCWVSKPTTNGDCGSPVG
jgi:hypothetical protein